MRGNCSIVNMLVYRKEKPCGVYVPRFLVGLRFRFSYIEKNSTIMLHKI